MLLKLYNKNNVPADLQRVIDLLNDGGLLIYPTDGKYAIGCHGLKERAIERICRLKGIDPKKNNLSIIFILNGTTRLPKIFRNRREVGIRMPDNPIIREIARLLDAPIMTTTLPHDEDDDPEYTTDPELIDEKYGDLVDLVIDGGIGGLDGSTVVDCTGDEPVIVRQGAGELLE